MPRGKLLGGPLDGAELGRSSRPTFIFITGSGDLDAKVRCFRIPGSGRHLYRHYAVEDGIETYLFAGHTHRLCEDCGGFNEVGEGERNPTCQLCGASLSPGKMAPS